jgi:uncharacterized protein YheU (UPF0270 family)
MSDVRTGHLLDVAEKVLAGTVATPRARAARAAAILARSALEDLVTDLCAREGIDVARTSMRVRLACLRALIPLIAGDAAVAWSGLSRACHQHAYEIAPNRSEVSHLVAEVRRVAATTQWDHVPRVSGRSV